MHTLVIDQANSTAAIARRMSTPTTAWFRVLLILGSRTLFFVIAQALVALILAWLKHPAPWEEAANWWPVDGILANIFGMAFLILLTRREGIGVWDLVSFDRRRLVGDIGRGLGVFLIAFPLALAGMIGVGILLYGSYAATPIVGGHLPLWAGLVSVLIFPILNAITEQMTYSAYSLPRLEVLTGKSFLAVAIVVFWFTLQHSALGLIFDWRFVLYRFFSYLPLCILVPVLYLRFRRLTPLIVCHWALDLVGSISLMLMR